MKSCDVAVIVGSLRKDSINRQFARILIGMAPENLRMEIVEIGDLPLYNMDLETDSPPAAWTAFRDRMKRAEAVLFMAPEYNRSMPAALKNAIDVGSRPFGQSVWGGKPAAIVSVSIGALGAFGSNHHLRQSLVYVDMPVMAQPEAYIGTGDKLLDANGAPNNDRTREVLGKFMRSFAAWIERTRI